MCGMRGRARVWVDLRVRESVRMGVRERESEGEARSPYYACRPLPHLLTRSLRASTDLSVSLRLPKDEKEEEMIIQKE